MKTKREKKGFTLVELLTVMSVIAVLIGILVPALNYVRIMAKGTSQSAQFHSISVALDIFNGENDGYPASSILPAGGTANLTIGAQRLAEALVGRDLLGFDSMTSWDADYDATTNPLKQEIYASILKKSSSQAQEDASIARRKGPYLSGGNIEAYEIGQLYTGGIGNIYDGSPASGNPPAPVLTDCYRVQSVTLANNKQAMAGSPILYYKANTSLTGSNIFPKDTDTSITDAMAKSYVYNSMDNEELINLGLMKDQVNVLTNPHHYDIAYTDPATSRTGRRLFYDAIENPKITSQPRAYNQDKYILISAGYDGKYGTRDDITNFGD
ncbi:MAG: type II secretion system protein [Phycisphaerae bacterium]